MKLIIMATLLVSLGLLGCAVGEPRPQASPESTAAGPAPATPAEAGPVVIFQLTGLT